ncbi:MAG: SprT-like domain-containing protein [Candidatus Adiutrix sp.]
MNMKAEFKHLSANLKSAWLRQLQREYGELLWRYNIKTPKITLELMQSETLWGRWQPGLRRLALSERLIMTQPWPCVVGILGHEVAHQLVDDLGGGPREISHGPKFKEMANRLGLDPFYAQASVDIVADCPAPWGQEAETLSDPNLKVLEKVRKLLALSSSPVLAEAQAAMSAAAKIMARHNLSLLDSDLSENNYERRTIFLGLKRLQSRFLAMAQILHNHFFVETIFVPSYNAKTDEEEKNLEVFGRPANTRLAEHVFYFLRERTETLWHKHKAQNKGGGLLARNSFMDGLLVGFEKKLSLAAKDFTANEGAAPKTTFSDLVLSKDLGLSRFVAHCYPHLKTVRTGGRPLCLASQEAGLSAGASLDFYRPLAQEEFTPNNDKTALLPSV